MTFPKPKNPILAFLFHPALPAGIVLLYAYYFFLRRFFEAHSATARTVEARTSSDPAFYCWALLLASTLFFADVFAFFATLGGPNVTRANMDEVRTLRWKLNYYFTKGWLFGLSVYLVWAGAAFYLVNRYHPEAGRRAGIAEGLVQAMRKHGILITIAYAVAAIVLLFVLPKRLSNLIIEKGWAKGLYRAMTGFAFVALVLLAVSFVRGQPHLFRKFF